MVELPTHLRRAPMGETAVSRAELSRHQRARVISKVTPVFAKRGYQATTVDDLLAAGKVGVGNFYSLFESKEECFLACLDRTTSAAQAQIDAAVTGIEDWDRRACRGLAAMLEWIVAEPLAARLILVEAQTAGVAATDRYNAILDRAVAWVQAGRQGHPDAADLPASFEEAAVSGLAFYLQQCLLDGPLPPADVLFAETADLLFGPILGAERLAALSRERFASAPR